MLLAERIRPLAGRLAAAALMTAGLLAKTALFPLHLWLPPAHANAPAPASAVLSGLVVKGSFFLTVRLWFYVLPALPAVGFDAILGDARVGGGPVRQRARAEAAAAQAADRLFDASPRSATCS